MYDRYEVYKCDEFDRIVLVRTNDLEIARKVVKALSTDDEYLVIFDTQAGWDVE